jgi:hypothetical protein
LAVSFSLQIVTPRAYAAETKAKNESVGAVRGSGATCEAEHDAGKKMDLARSAFGFELFALAPVALRPSSSLAQANRFSARERKCFILKHGRIFMVSSIAVVIRDRVVEAEGSKAIKGGVTAARDVEVG